MASNFESVDIRCDKSATAVDETHSKILGKHRKGRPSIDVELAQNYKERQDLPPIEQGADPGFEEAEDMASLETAVVKIILDDGPNKADKKTIKKGTKKQPEVSEKEQNPKWPEDKTIKPADDGPPRDRVTGRVISEEARTCLRCQEKGLRCTLNYVGKELEPQCAACRRSKTQYCVRFRPWDPEGVTIQFTGPPWKNPNFVAGTADGPAKLPQLEMEELIRDHYEGEKGYVAGHYIPLNDKRNFALPPFNGADLAEDDRPEDYQSITWKEALPIWHNRSLRPRKAATAAAQKNLDKAEDEKKALTDARYELLHPTKNPYNEADAKPNSKDDKGKGKGKAQDKGQKQKQASKPGSSKNAAANDVEKKDKNKSDADIDNEDGKETETDQKEGEKEKETEEQKAERMKKEQEDIGLLRILRRYPPREQNLSDVLGETW